MKEDRAAAAGNARAAVVIDLDNEIIEMVVAPEPVAAACPIPPHRPVVVPACGVFAPGVFRPNGANRQECTRPRVAVSAPPQLPRPGRAFWGAAGALPLCGPNGSPPH